MASRPSSRTPSRARADERRAAVPSNRGQRSTAPALRPDGRHSPRRDTSRKLAAPTYRQPQLRRSRVPQGCAPTPAGGAGASGVEAAGLNGHQSLSPSRARMRRTAPSGPADAHGPHSRPRGRDDFIVVTQNVADAAISCQGMRGSALFSFLGMRRQASEMISISRFTARFIGRRVREVRKSASPIASRAPAMAVRMSCRQMRGRLPSKEADGRRLDPLLQHRVEAVACHDVGVDAEDRVDPILHTYEFDETEPGIVLVKKQVDIARLPSLATGRRAEQVERHDPLRAKLLGVATQPRDCCFPVHRRISRAAHSRFSARPSIATLRGKGKGGRGMRGLRRLRRGRPASRT